MTGGFLVLPDGKRVEVRNGLTLGRAADCDLVLADSKASRHHARLIVEGGVVEIEDLGSSNGTLLNGKPVRRRLLRAGDTVQIGKTLLAYQGTGDAAATTPAGAASPAADDVDLFGDEPAAPEAAAATPVVPAPPPAPPPPPAAAPAEVLEFEDEVVEVRKAPPPRPSPPASAKASPARPAPPRPAGSTAPLRGGTGDGGLLRDDLAQMPGWQRNALILLALAAAVGLGYLAMVVARG